MVKKRSKGYLIRAVGVVIAGMLASCGGEVPDCASTDATSLVSKIVVDNKFSVDIDLHPAGLVPDWSTIRVDAIREKGQNAQTGERACAARYLVDTSANRKLIVLQRDIAYTVEKTDKKGEIYVTVENTGRVQVAADAKPVSQPPVTKAPQAPPPQTSSVTPSDLKTIRGEVSCGNQTCSIEDTFFGGPEVYDKVLPVCQTGDQCEIVGSIDENGNLTSVASVKKLPGDSRFKGLQSPPPTNQCPC